MKHLIAFAAFLVIITAVLASLGGAGERPAPAGSVGVTEPDARLPSIKVAAVYGLH